ncbi:hypothetical protein B0T11DRAFT_92337 [Plectosphaerella cucumerina]|uniref:Uncharacterized protein n=1 Tax=Plectosphaerella cucumerina TaxID=40658 RepID=A0A8K0TH08_9PEZI|nr:hypothetical protein B0T11DRAFT_92337 [Plectosphaerella cucumerina]
MEVSRQSSIEQVHQQVQVYRQRRSVETVEINRYSRFIHTTGSSTQQVHQHNRFINTTGSSTQQLTLTSRPRPHPHPTHPTHLQQLIKVSSRDVKQGQRRHIQTVSNPHALAASSSKPRRVHRTLWLLSSAMFKKAMATFSPVAFGAMFCAGVVSTSKSVKDTRTAKMPSMSVP